MIISGRKYALVMICILPVFAAISLFAAVGSAKDEWQQRQAPVRKAALRSEADKSKALVVIGVIATVCVVLHAGMWMLWRVAGRPEGLVSLTPSSSRVMFAVAYIVGLGFGIAMLFQIG